MPIAHPTAAVRDGAPSLLAATPCFESGRPFAVRESVPGVGERSGGLGPGAAQVQAR
ncbi:hypothetical protein ACFYNL_19800 [Streptomyces sp. NPDC007808]|uniref:hypothetical protein n=1 Tax=Streptomyces sp. NPDC007808 TaxID=3364779 RepID=UPI0036A4FC27